MKRGKIYFVTGIDTGIGKTIVSSILVESGKTDYWKPVQSGSNEITDSATIKNLISNNISHIHKEAYLLKEPISPHAAAKKENIEIVLSNIKLPQTNNHLIVEGAGGLLVPLNQQETIMDLIKSLNIEVILVSKNYLGSINHTLLSLEVLKTNNVPVKGIIFNGGPNKETEEIIHQKTSIPILARIDHMAEVSPLDIKRESLKLKHIWN